MSRIIDITMPLRPGMSVWPGDPPLEVDRLTDCAAGDEATLSRLSMSVHTGTHVDAPAHFLGGGATVDALELSSLVGPAWVADATGGVEIGAADLAALALPGDVRRLLLKTRTAPPDGNPSPSDAYTNETAARWIAERGIRLVGIDTPSIAPYDRPAETHRILLSAGIVIVENLDLAAVVPGAYVLACLPLPVVGAEGAPARAVLLDERGLP